MKDFKEIPQGWDFVDDQDWKAALVSDPVVIPNKRTWLRGQCGRIFACACGTGGGFLLAHAGCIASYALTFSSVGLATGLSASGAALGLSMGSAAAGVGVWYAARGRIAGPWEKRLTLGGAAIGAAMSLSMHFSGAGHHSIADADKALNYYHSMPPESQEQMRNLPPGFGLYELLSSICGPTKPSDAPKPEQR